MEEIFLNLLKSTPGLAVAVIIVVIFLRHLGKKDEQDHQVQKEGHEVLREVCTAMTEVTSTLRSMNGRGK